jgi:crotonobetainyl-CoA:carnitine CoA-transferase CaiB-like acyl-CoA transferase
MTDYTPYAGIMVADLSQGLAGPYCAMQLAAFGAEVVKLEPLNGDWSRPLGTTAEDLSATFVAVNQGKRSIAVDLASAEGQAVALRLALASHVVIESFRPGVADQLGFGYAAVKAQHPDVIYVSISGYGQAGPARTMPATDTILQGLTGMAHNNRDGAGVPHKVYLTPIDYGAGQYAAHAVAAALLQQSRTGEGRHIDVSLLATASALQGLRMTEASLTAGDIPLELFTPLGLFEAADGHVAISTVKERHFPELCGHLGCPELAEDPRFADHPRRLANLDALVEALNLRFSTRPKAHWTEVLTTGGMMCAPVNDYEQFLDGGMLAEAGGLTWVDQAPLGTIPLPAIPGTARALGKAPRLGEHSLDVLAELGLSEAERDSLAESGRILTTPAG